jgi:hypothetical protein
MTNVSIIIREVGERTLSLCRALAEAEVGAERVVTISEVPFEKALRKTYELGSEMDTPWVLVVDADILLRQGAVADLLHIAEQLDANVFEVQGRVLDKLAQGFRGAGIHMYRAALMKTAMQLMPAEGQVIRPERYTMTAMQKTGFAWLSIPDIVMGLHDYQQYCRDIWCKAFLHAKKHASWLPYVQPLWHRLAKDDADFQAALMGLEAGRQSNSDGKTDIRVFDMSEIERDFQEHGIAEKASLAADAMTTQEVSLAINEFDPPPEYWNLLAGSRPIDAPQKSASKKIRSFVCEKGLLRLIPWLLGVALVRIGRRLKEVV